jgi:hypothetical protein
MPLLLDFSQVALANMYPFQDKMKKTSANKEEAINILRHAIITGIKYYKVKFGKQYGQVVLACDGKQYWRRDIFPHYKAGRKATRDASDLDWKLIFDCISTIRDEIAEHFPYKVIHLDNVEGDDIIAVLCKWHQTNALIDYGMFEEPEPIVIVSSDKDYVQLHKYSNVKQWSPIQKKAVTSDNPQEYLMRHIAKASDDGIPGVLSPDDVFVTEGTRQPKMSAKRLDEFIRLGRDACRDDFERRNWDRNNALINFDMIPDQISQQIVDAYINCKPKGDKMSIYGYLIKNRCRLLLDSIEEL